MSRLSRFIHFYTDEDDGNGGEKGVLKTVTGALLHIVDALAKPINKFTATLEPIQDLHGQDAPYPAGGGKNLADENITFELRGTITATVADDGTITINGSNPSNEASYLRGSFHCPDQTATYTWALFNPTADTSIEFSVRQADYGPAGGWATASVTNKTNTFTVDDGKTAVYWQVQIRTGATINNFKMKPMIVSGATAPTSYAPYSNECPITGHTGANVVRTGKNLLPNKTFLNSTRLTFGTDVGDLAPIPFKLQAGTYKFSYEYTGNIGSVFIKVNDGGNINIGSQNYTFTLTEDSTVIMWAYNGSGLSQDNLKWFQLELGSTATTYEEYKGTTIPIAFPDAAGTVYGGTLTNEGREWKLVVDKVSAIFDGSSDEGWMKYGTQTEAWKRQSWRSMALPYRISERSGANIGCIGNGAIPLSTTSETTGKDDDKITCRSTAYASQNFYIFTPLSLNYELTDLQTMLSNNPVQFVYPLETPIEYTLTESQALTLLKGENVVWCDGSDDLELQYYAKAEETP